MKINISLSLKITLIVVSVSALIIASLTYININWQAGFFEDDYRERADVLAKTLDASFESTYKLNDTVNLQSYIEKVNYTNPDLLKISVNLPDEDEESLIVYISSEIGDIGTIASRYTLVSYKQSIEKNEDIVVLISQDNKRPYTITVIMPVNISGRIVGSYEMIFSMDKTYAILDAQISYLILLAVLSLFVVIIVFLFLLRRTIVKPITSLRDDAKLVGKGDLDVKIDIKSRDELGELATAFNQMTSDLKSSRAKIQRYSKTLEKLLKQKDEFIGQLGHDLKNPLQPLVGLLPIIMEQEKDPKLKEHLGVIVHNVEYMRDLIFETLELARLRSSNIKFDIKNVNLKEEIDKVFQNQQHYLKENKIKIKNKVNNYIFVIADPLRLAELFNNLITNAVKYTPKNNGIVTIDAKEDNDFVKVSVTDNGIGMTEEQLNRIFDEFYMADESRRKIDSSGLGLPICKRIVEKHGGKIWVESAGKGKGSSFYFTLKIGKKERNKDDLDNGEVI